MDEILLKVVPSAVEQQKEESDVIPEVRCKEKLVPGL